MEFIERPGEKDGQRRRRFLSFLRELAESIKVEFIEHKPATPRPFVNFVGRYRKLHKAKMAARISA